MIEKVSSHSIVTTSRGQEPLHREKIQSEIKIDGEYQPQKKGVESKEELENVVNSMNEFLQPTHTSLKFELHDKLNEYYVAIVDDNTKEVIREIPSKKLLDMHAAMAEYLGLLVDKKI